VRSAKTNIDMHSKNNEKSRILFRLENNVVLEYLSCDDVWCNVKIKNKKGWVKADEVYGN
jgi:SH3-like domain-containing protein